MGTRDAESRIPTVLGIIQNSELDATALGSEAKRLIFILLSQLRRFRTSRSGVFEGGEAKLENSFTYNEMSRSRGVIA